MMKSIIQKSLAVLLVVSACTKEKLEDIGITKEDIITSSFVKDDYRIRYFLPPDYSADKKYPVVYLLDGDWYFDRMAREINELWESNSIPECILVGIGNSEERARDYSYPATSYDSESGGGDKFYSFITSELIPHVDSTYYTDTTKRVLAGHSYGGFFTLYAMFHYESTAPGLFSFYIAASPSIWWDNGYLFGLEKSLAQNTNHLPYHLYLSVGGDEAPMVIYTEEMYDRLTSREYDNFYITKEIIKGKSHSAASIPGFINGLKFVLNN